MAYSVTVTSTKLIIDELGIQVRFDGRDIIKATATNALTPQTNTSPREYIVQLTLTGDAAVSGLPNPYIIRMSDVSNQPTWTNDTAGCNQAAADISVMIRSVTGGGGGGQVDTIVPGDAIDVDSTDPVNPIVNVKVDGVTIGFNGSNELESIVTGGITQLTGDVTAGPGSGSVAATIPNDTVTNAKLANMAQATIKGRAAGAGTGDPTDLTANQASSVLDTATDPFIRTSAQIQKSTGGNGAADAGKVQEFNTEGQIFGSVENSSAAAVQGQSTGTGYAGHFSGSKGFLTLNGGDAMVEIFSGIFPVNVIQSGAGDIAHFEVLSGQGLEVKNDGGLNWTSGTGAQTTADNLPVFGALTKGVVPAAGAVPSASNFLDETGSWSIPAGTGMNQLTGDVTAGPGSGSQAATLASVIAAGGPTGSATVTPIITYDAKGRLTAVSSATITPAASSITSPQALTKVDDTNVTLTLGGTPSTALLQAASITVGWTGQLSISRGGTGQSTQTAAFDALAPTTTKGDIIVHDGTDNIRVAIGSDGMVPFADSGATSGVEWRYPVLEVPIMNLALTLTNQPNTLEMLTATIPGIFITRMDLSNYTEVMLQIHVFVASVSANSPRIILGYANSYTTTAGSYSDIGTSAVTCSMSSTGIIRSAWIPIAAGALGDVYISPLSNGGNATADPQIQGIRMYVR